MIICSTSVEQLCNFNQEYTCVYLLDMIYLEDGDENTFTTRLKFRIINKNSPDNFYISTINQPKIFISKYTEII